MNNTLKIFLSGVSLLLVTLHNTSALSKDEWKLTFGNAKNPGEIKMTIDGFRHEGKLFEFEADIEEGRTGIGKAMDVRNAILNETHNNIDIPPFTPTINENMLIFARKPSITTDSTGQAVKIDHMSPKKKKKAKVGLGLDDGSGVLENVDSLGNESIFSMGFEYTTDTDPVSYLSTLPFGSFQGNTVTVDDALNSLFLDLQDQLPPLEMDLLSLNLQENLINFSYPTEAITASASFEFSSRNGSGSIEVSSVPESSNLMALFVLGIIGTFPIINKK